LEAGCLLLPGISAVSVNAWNAKDRGTPITPEEAVYLILGMGTETTVVLIQNPQVVYTVLYTEQTNEIESMIEARWY
jgi:hypothetical protein